MNCFYESIISVLKLSAGHSIPTSDTSTKYNIVPGWNEYVKEHHSLAKDAQWWCCSHWSMSTSYCYYSL